LIAGGNVLIQRNGVTWLQAKIQQTFQIFSLDNIPVNVGDVFTVWQTVGSGANLLSSNAVKSPPVENLHLGSSLPTPGMQPQPVACTANATFENLILNAYLNWTNTGVDASVQGVNEGTESWNWGGPDLQAGPITAQQSFNKCNIASPIFQGTVLPAPPLGTPILPDALCSLVTSFHVSGLNTPATLYVEATLPYSNSTGNTTIMQTVKYATSQAEVDIPIPLNWFGIPSATFQFWQMTPCGQGPESTPLTIKTLDSMPVPVVVAPIYECSHFIHVQQATPDCMMYVMTAPTGKDGVALSDNFTVTQSDFYIHTDTLYQPLYIPENIVVVQWGCSQNQKSTPVAVSPITIPLPVPTITTVLRPGDTSVAVSGVNPGAEVYLLINGDYFGPNFSPWASDVEALSTSVTLNLNSPLVAGQIVTPVQAMCGNISVATNTTGTPVNKATLNVMPSPLSITKGQTSSLYVSAVDPQTGISNDPHWGLVSWDGDSFALGSSVSQAIAADDTRSSIVGNVLETAYNNLASFTIQLEAAPPPTFNLQLSGGPVSFVNNATNATVFLSSVTWRVNPEWAPSLTVSLTGSTNLDFLVATHPFTKPPASAKGVTDFIEVTGTATFSADGQSVSVPLTGQLERDPADNSATSCMAWYLDYTVDDEGNIDWPNGQHGNGPITPFGLSC
jgi:hypothetical protein